MSDFFHRFAILFKVGLIAFFALLLLIPLGMVESVMHERMQRRDEAVRDITSTWGGTQTLAGPVLVVPCEYNWEETETKLGPKGPEMVKVTRIGTYQVCFLPDELFVDGSIEPVRRHRGIYESILYRADLHLRGSFAHADPEPYRPPNGKIRWDEAYLSLSVSDLRGVRDILKLHWNDAELPVEPGVNLPGFSSGVHVKLPEGGGGRRDFELNFSVNGSDTLNFTPAGVHCQVNLKSTWTSPSFCGAFLPARYELNPKGFNAWWEIAYYGRKYPQSWLTRDGSAFSSESSRESAFGVRFANANEQYRSVERALKYGILFITLVFLTFFLFEITCRLRVHVFQYILVGAALCLFYLALLSLSELIPFAAAYVTATIAGTLLISLYSLSVLKSGRRTLLVTAGMLGIYAFLYVILQLEDYSLLVGTVGLFLALGAVMFATRKINWYGDEPCKPPALPKN